MFKKFNIHEWMPVIIVVGALLLAPLALYLASAIYFALHKINPFQAELFSLVDYFQADPTDRKKQLLALFLGLLITYAILPTAIYLLTQKRRELHGSARFANTSEIRKANLLQKEGVLVGKVNGQLMRFPGQQFVLLAAPTRSGKGVGIVIPNCLTWTQSLVVLDIKQENFGFTSGYRQKVLWQQVYLFNPFAEETDKDGKPLPRTHRWNPFSNVASGVFRVGELMNLGRSFWPKTGDKDEFWNNLALNLFLAITLFLFELKEQRNKEITEGKPSTLPDYPVSIGEVLRQSSGRGTGQPVKKYLARLIKDYDWLSGECRDSVSEFLSSSDDVLASILSTFNAPLGIWRNPIVDAATSESDFDLNDVRKKRMTVYIGVTPNQLPNAANIINLLFSQLVNLNTKELPKDNPKLKYACLLLMDEFTAIGKVPIIVKAVSYIAGYNLRLFPIVQSVAQLESVLGKEDARTFVTNHAMQIIYAPREQKDANEYSEMLGYFTEKSASISRPKGFMGGKSGPSESVSDQKRALLLPQEFKELGQKKEVVLLENTKPILCEKIEYWSDPFFKERLLKPIEIQPMDIDGFISRTQNRHRPVQESDIDAENTRIAENQREQLLALEQPYDTPMNDDASEEDWLNYGAHLAQINSPATPAECSAIKARFSALTNALDSDEAMPLNAPRSDDAAKAEAASMMAEMAQQLKEEEEQENSIENDESDERGDGSTFFDDIPQHTFSEDKTMQFSDHPPTAQPSDANDNAPWVGGTPIDESDISAPELDDEYVANDNPEEDQP